MIGVYQRYKPAQDVGRTREKLLLLYEIIMKSVSKYRTLS